MTVAAAAVEKGSEEGAVKKITKAKLTYPMTGEGRRRTDRVNRRSR